MEETKPEIDDYIIVIKVDYFNTSRLGNIEKVISIEGNKGFCVDRLNRNYYNFKHSENDSRDFVIASKAMKILFGVE